MRWLLTGTMLALAACGTVPGGTTKGAGAAPPMTVETGRGLADQASDVPVLPSFPGFRLPSLRRGWAPSDERPNWLPRVPENPARHPVPDEWYRDNMAALRPPRPAPS